MDWSGTTVTCEGKCFAACRKSLYACKLVELTFARLAFFFSRGLYFLLWAIQGGDDRLQGIVFVLSVGNRVYHFVRLRPNYKQGIACVIDLICEMKSVCTPSIEEQNEYKVNLLFCNCQ